MHLRSIRCIPVGTAFADRQQELDSEYLVSLRTSHLLCEAEEEVPWTLDGEYGGSLRSVEVHSSRWRSPHADGILQPKLRCSPSQRGSPLAISPRSGRLPMCPTRPRRNPSAGWAAQLISLRESGGFQRSRPIGCPSPTTAGGPRLYAKSLTVPAGMYPSSGRGSHCIRPDTVSFNVPSPFVLGKGPF